MLLFCSVLFYLLVPLLLLVLLRRFASSCQDEAANRQQQLSCTARLELRLHACLRLLLYRPPQDPPLRRAGQPGQQQLAIALPPLAARWFFVVLAIWASAVAVTHGL